MSVLPTASKLFERIIYDQLYNYLSTNNLLTKHQSGFRSLHSTATVLLEATNEWYFNVDQVLFQKRVRVFQHDFQTRETDESTRPLRPSAFIVFECLEIVRNTMHEFLK